jgi:hypothetical protein
MKIKFEAAAEPQWDEAFEDDAAAEQEAMRLAEIALLEEGGCPDIEQIKWLEWAVTGYEEAEWTVECTEDTANWLEENMIVHASE